jgi:hypothetical protein
LVGGEARVLLLATEPAAGLTGEHVEQLATWAKLQRGSSNKPFRPAPAREALRLA